MAGTWQIEVRAGANQCLRFDVLSQFADLRMTVIAPDGTVYGNDDRGGDICALCSLVKISPTTQKGEYTVTLSTQNGSVAEGNFMLSFGAYNPNNDNCGSPTPPRSTGLAAERLQ